MARLMDDLVAGDHHVEGDAKELIAFCGVSEALKLATILTRCVGACSLPYLVGLGDRGNPLRFGSPVVQCSDKRGSCLRFRT